MRTALLTGLALLLTTGAVHAGEALDIVIYGATGRSKTTGDDAASRAPISPWR